MHTPILTDIPFQNCASILFSRNSEVHSTCTVLIEPRVFVESLGKCLLQVLCVILMAAHISAQTVEWHKMVGGSQRDGAEGAVIDIASGDVVICGSTTSIDDDLTNLRRFSSELKSDAMLIKMDQAGTTKWIRTYGGSRNDGFDKVVQLLDGGYACLGVTNSIDGDVQETGDSVHSDLWLVRVDKLGNIQWQRRYGGNNLEDAVSLCSTDDGGFVIGANTWSVDGDAVGHHGGDSTSDIWILRLDSLGNIGWKRQYGGSGNDQLSDMIATTDGHFDFVGFSNSTDGDLLGHSSDTSGWIVSLDSTGNIAWQRSGNGNSIVESSNGDLMICGSRGTAGSGDSNEKNCLVVRLDRFGNQIWEKSFGAPRSSGGGYGELIVHDGTGGFLVQGIVFSNGGDVSGYPSNAAQQVWLVDIDSEGIIKWSHCYGGSYQQVVGSLLIFQKTIFLIGFSASNDLDCAGNHGDLDAWVVKIALTNSLVRGAGEIPMEEHLTVFPNPVYDHAIVRLPMDKLHKESTTITIYDESGRMVEKTALLKESEQYTWERRKLRAGAYLMVARRENVLLGQSMVVLR